MNRKNPSPASLSRQFVEASESAPDPALRFEAIVNSSEDAIISKDLNGIITSWNPAATRIFGYLPEEIIGQSVLKLIPPELHREEEEVLERLRAGNRIEHYETVRVTKSSEKIPISVTISPVKNPDGRVVGASKIARDISDRRKNEESRFRLAAIVDSAEDAIISKDLNGIVRTWNTGAARMFGYRSEEMIGRSILQLIPEDLRSEEDEILRKLRAGERIEHYETTRRKKNGENFDVSVTISPIFDEKGSVIGASKIARDISDRKQMERVLVQSEKLAATGRMAAAIAHEINNPLDALMNLIFLSRESSRDNPEAKQYLRLAEQELGRVAHIARQTLGFYRESSSPAEVYMRDLVEDVLTVYGPKMGAAKISVDTRFNELQKILVNKGEMIQIFSNIIANAIDAMRNGGILRILTRKVSAPAGDGVQIVIRDTRTGIAHDNLPRIFEPFFTTKGTRGTGIGLWVARQLVESRGGSVSVASSTEPGNSGTTITIFMPFHLPMTPGNSNSHKNTRRLREDSQLTLVADRRSGTSDRK